MYTFENVYVHAKSKFLVHLKNGLTIQNVQRDKSILTNRILFNVLMILDQTQCFIRNSFRHFLIFTCRNRYEISFNRIRCIIANFFVMYRHECITVIISCSTVLCTVIITIIIYNIIIIVSLKYLKSSILDIVQ